MAQHHAFWPPGGAGGVEQPGKIVGLAWQRRGGALPVARTPVVVAIDREGRKRRRIRFRPVIRRVVTDEQQLCTGVLTDPRGFPAMQLGVDRHRRRADPPDAVEAFEIGGAVGHEQGDAVAGRDAVSPGKMRAHRRRASGKGEIIRVDTRTRQQRGRIRTQMRARRQPLGHVHDRPPAA